MAAKKDELIGLNRDRELEIKQLDHKLSKARNDAKDARERVGQQGGGGGERGRGTRRGRGRRGWGGEGRVAFGECVGD